MKQVLLITIFAVVAIFAVSSDMLVHTKPAVAQATPLDWPAVDVAMGITGKIVQPGDVHRYSAPRSDLKVKIGSVTLKANFALGSHIEFMQTGPAQAMAMGDLVLTEKEVGPVMARLEQNGIDVTALHNHLLNESPEVMYLHISATGDPVAIANAIHSALLLTKTPLHSAKPSQTTIALDTKSLDSILRNTGSANNGILQYSIPRKETITDNRVTIPPPMGVATTINFQPLDKGKAAITGDFVLVGQEVNPVIQVLTANGISATALHSHSLTENPRLFYMHFWATGDALTLGRGLRTALDKMNSQ